jgi:hypothetical protein
MTGELPKHLSGLLDPGAYPHPVGEVKLVETHVSWVLLAGDRAYKIKRPVHYAFVDLTSPDRRAFFCCEEVRLNRRFAPDLYIGVSEITETDGKVRIGGYGRVIERAVTMRRFSREEELDRLLESNRIEPAELADFGRRLADIHATLPPATPVHAWGRPAAVRALVLDNVTQCVQAAAAFGAQARVESLKDSIDALLSAGETWMSARFLGKRVRECHGDLHSANIVRQTSGLVAFDCMEFEPAFRWVDVADEIAFLLADLQSRERPGHAQAFLNAWLSQSGDYEACRFVRLYIAHRALVRAKVAALSAASSDEGTRATLRERFTRLVGTASDALAPPRPYVVLMSGLSGSGKTWLASQLALDLGAVHLRSDVERKRLAGIAEQERSTSEVAGGIYAQRNTEQVYEHLLKSAAAVVAGRYPVIVDATFSRREERAKFRRLAAELGLDLCIVYCDAPQRVLRERIMRREQARRDASEANLAVLAWQQERFQELRADEGLPIIRADTTEHDVASITVQRVRACTTKTRRAVGQT